MASSRAVTAGSAQAGWWALEIDCRSELAKAALWRLSGPGHRCCIMRCGGERTAIQAFVSRSSVPPEAIAELFVGLHLDAEAQALPAPHIEWQEVDTWDWPEHHKQSFQPVPIGQAEGLNRSGW